MRGSAHAEVDMSIFCCRKIAGKSRTRKFRTLSSRFVGRGNDTCRKHRHDDARGLGLGNPNPSPFAARLPPCLDPVARLNSLVLGLRCDRTSRADASPCRFAMDRRAGSGEGAADPAREDDQAKRPAS